MLLIHKTSLFIIFLEVGGANTFLSVSTFKTKRKKNVSKKATTCRGGQSKKKNAKAMAAPNSASKYTLEYLYFL